MLQVHNKTVYKEFRRYLRNNATPAEVTLWTALKGRQLNNLKFRRQHSVGKYVLDFYCAVKRLAIEVDGPNHAENAIWDSNRTAFLAFYGIRVIRFTNDEVFNDLQNVLIKISNAISEPPPAVETGGGRGR
jgi:very-short-patch-repair endonuclease